MDQWVGESVGGWISRWVDRWVGGSVGGWISRWVGTYEHVYIGGWQVVSQASRIFPRAHAR